MTPATTMAALSRIVITGRRMNSSDRFIVAPPRQLGRRARRPPRPAHGRRRCGPPAATRRAGAAARIGRTLDDTRAGAQVLPAVDDDTLAHADPGDHRVGAGR